MRLPFFAIGKSMLIILFLVKSKVVMPFTQALFQPLRCVTVLVVFVATAYGNAYFNKNCLQIAVTGRIYTFRLRTAPFIQLRISEKVCNFFILRKYDLTV